MVVSTWRYTYSYRYGLKPLETIIFRLKMTVLWSLTDVMHK